MEGREDTAHASPVKRRSGADPKKRRSTPCQAGDPGPALPGGGEPSRSRAGLKPAPTGDVGADLRSAPGRPPPIERLDSERRTPCPAENAAGRRPVGPGGAGDTQQIRSSENVANNTQAGPVGWAARLPMAAGCKAADYVRQQFTMSNSYRRAPLGWPRRTPRLARRPASDMRTNYEHFRARCQQKCGLSPQREVRRAMKLKTSI